MSIHTYTQQEKVVAHMLNERARQEWFYPPDFMQGGMQLFVGYEASARLSELATDYPQMVESRRRGKYIERRIRYDAVAEWWPLLPETLQGIFDRHGVSPASVEL